MNLKSSFTEDKMPVHALDAFIEIHGYYLCLKFVMLSPLFIAALWSPAGIALTAYFCLKNMRPLAIFREKRTLFSFRIYNL